MTALTQLLLTLQRSFHLCGYCDYCPLHVYFNAYKNCLRGKIWCYFILLSLPFLHKKEHTKGHIFLLSPASKAGPQRHYHEVDTYNMNIALSFERVFRKRY